MTEPEETEIIIVHPADPPEPWWNRRGAKRRIANAVKRVEADHLARAVETEAEVQARHQREWEALHRRFDPPQDPVSIHERLRLIPYGMGKTVIEQTNDRFDPPTDAAALTERLHLDGWDDSKEAGE